MDTDGADDMDDPGVAFVVGFTRVCQKVHLDIIFDIENGHSYPHQPVLRGYYSFPQVGHLR